jgi:cytochrome o ubiquinol oxidase subunit 3
MSLLPHQETAADARTTLGFWIYLMTDCVLFASLFATFAVLHANTYGGPSGAQIFSLPFVLAETLILLASSFCCGLGILAARRRQRQRLLFWLSLTFILGLSFLTLEISEFHKLASEGNSWQRSGFLSAFFTLVGTHGLHITAGLIWMLTMMARVLGGGLTPSNLRRLTLLGLFWHFLDVIWIFIFTVVYLIGGLPS